MTTNETQDKIAISQETIAKIIAKKEQQNFEGITKGFAEKLKTFDPTKNCFAIKDYFGEKKGKVAAANTIFKDSIINIEQPINDQGHKLNDFKGLYVFLHNDGQANIPFYVGISQKVISRILQHLKSRTHHSASLAFNIGLHHYLQIAGEPYKGPRKELIFDKYVKPIQEFLMEQKIAFIPIECDQELYLFEIYVAMNLGTSLNTFHTH